MKSIKITVTGCLAAVTEAFSVVSGTVGLPVEFIFDDAWEGLNKTAVFRANGKSLDRLNISEETTMPWEILKTPGCRLYIGVYGTNADGSLQIPTVWADLGVIQPGADPSGDESADPTLPVWEQVQKDAVKCTPQNLTEAQQDQARKNIGAMRNGVADTDLNMNGNVIRNIDFAAFRCISEDKNEEIHIIPYYGNGFYLSFNGLKNGQQERIRLINIEDGKSDSEAATVGQLNAAVGDIEAALDGILAVQESLIGGAAI